MKYVALLRGINVGGNRVIKMTALREMFASAKASDVVTYIASGNVVFEHPERSAAKLTETLGRTISKLSGFDVTLTLRSAKELSSVIENNPFAGEATEHLHMMFLPGRIPAGSLASIASPGDERFELVERELYFCLPNGLGRSQLVGKMSSVKALAGGTTRNWRTVLALADLAGVTGQR
jgi:uncharacterized protein (DUF1697 family)